MQIPSRDTCFGLIHEMEMMDHIVDHSHRVCRVALFLTDELHQVGVVLHRDLIEAAALLHDITKTRSFETGENHAASGDEFLSARGYPEVGNIVGQHVRLNSYFGSEVPSEAEVVNYADKRVLHDRVVSLDARMAYIVERYGQDPALDAKIRNLWKKTRSLEARLFDRLSFTPDDLPQLVAGRAAPLPPPIAMQGRR